MRIPANLLKHAHFKPSKLQDSPSLKNTAIATPTIFLHGYLGSRKTFTKLSRHVTTTLNSPSYTLDLRNHGDSFHSPDVGYNAMTADLEQFVKFHNIEKEGSGRVNLVGYSMGAKVALNYAFRNPSLVNKIVCIDNAPVSRYIPRELFADVIAVMRQVEGLKGSPITAKTWKKAALSLIKPKLKGDDALSLYVLDNFKFDNSLGHQVRLKVPGYLLTDHTLDLLGEFPGHNEPLPSNVKSLFIKASQSGFIDEEAIAKSKELISGLTVKEFEGTHHAVFIQHYKEIENLIETFLAESY